MWEPWGWGSGCELSGTSEDTCGAAGGGSRAGVTGETTEGPGRASGGCKAAPASDPTVKMCWRL